MLLFGIYDTVFEGKLHRLRKGKVIVMQFVKTNDLKPGMRLAKPIYNKMGVLLYERNTKLTLQGITSVENFGLIGLFILEPAEPVPPITKEELEFEQFQTIYMFKLKDDMDRLQKAKSITSVRELAENIYMHYGTLDHKLHFTQNLRSSVDFVYKHAISVAILTAMISNTLRLNQEQSVSLISAALLYDFGYLYVPHSILEKGDDLTTDDEEVIQLNLEKGFHAMEPLLQASDLSSLTLDVIRLMIFSRSSSVSMDTAPALKLFADILKVADKFDRMTAMNINKAPVSELAAMKHLRSNTSIYNSRVVNALSISIHILPNGACIDLSDGSKALVVQENPDNFLYPMILSFEDNQLYDLSDTEVQKKFKIQDIMKTMDNRIHIDAETLKQFVADDLIKQTVQRFREKKMRMAEKRRQQEEEQTLTHIL